MKMLDFRPTYLGLQIKWIDSEELEFIGMACLQGKSQTTAATCRHGRGYLHYRYAVESRREGNTLSLSYSAAPTNWPPAMLKKGIVVGTTKIFFKGNESCDPVKVTWWPKGEAKPIAMEEGSEWSCLTEPAAVTTDTKRVRSLVSRLVRSEQPVLRNRLLAERPQCLITGIAATTALEACHLVPVKDGGPDCDENAILLRRDLHALFDAGCLDLVVGEEGCRVRFASGVRDKEYCDLEKQSKVNPIAWDRIGEWRRPYLEARASMPRESEQNRLCGEASTTAQ